MSTAKKTITTGRSQPLRRFSQLASLGEVVFHVSDLASLWGIVNKNTLHTTLKRYAQKKLLYRLWRGMYALKPMEQIDPLVLGIKAIHSYTYISTETILYRLGVISQKPSSVTLISSVSRRFTLSETAYLSRKLVDKFLYQSIGISDQAEVREATLERAVADLLYYNPQAYFDAPLDWKKIKQIQKAVGYPPTPLRYQ